MISVFLSSLTLASCGAKSTKSTTGVSLSGKVTIKGNPVVGYILVESETGGNAARSPFDADGSYIISSAPLGKVKVKVNLSPRHMHKESDKKGLPTPKESVRALPAIDLHDGKNEFSVDLQ
ncbi:hypothetical protein [Fimbriiglobus ruber]|uniref:Carboxypeptidase regulatory-like domain-containing protein n=1 Tax=Fimbriiglobus ruber TaxID=1908690 RepID=A0A225E1L3_9BACT|nr:hypothetical protein [Fimbriiglobus ruber]OWK43916.1 hypothetical protein FRUB_03515 [Fimbriiglobus ruber]